MHTMNILAIIISSICQNFDYLQICIVRMVMVKCCVYMCLQEGDTPLHEASEEGHVAVIGVLLIKMEQQLTRSMT